MLGAESVQYRPFKNRKNLGIRCKSVYGNQTKGKCESLVTVGPKEQNKDFRLASSAPRTPSESESAVASEKESPPVDDSELLRPLFARLLVFPYYGGAALSSNMESSKVGT